MADLRAAGAILEEVEETNLDEILTALRAALGPVGTEISTTETTPYNSKHHTVDFPIPGLDTLVSRNLRTGAQSLPLQLCGRYLPLIYELVSILISGSHQSKAIVIIDTEGCFDSTRLTGNGRASNEDLNHVYVYRPARCSAEELQELIAAAEARMLYGRHGSRSREWWGIIVIGSLGLAAPGIGVRQGKASSRVHVTASWKGWMKVERDGVTGFPPGTSAREALADREKRQEVVDTAGWVASCPWGGFTFGSRHEDHNGPATGTNNRQPPTE